MRKILVSVIVIAFAISLIFMSNQKIRPVKTKKNPVALINNNIVTKELISENKKEILKSANGIRQPDRKEVIISSVNTKEGIIGRLDPNKNDNPTDNVFHVTLSDIKPGDQAWLEYELFGAEDYTSVCTGINDGVSFGGWLVKLNNRWTPQKIEINPELLRKGDNVIRFSVPSHADFCYKVRNVQLHLKPADLNERRLVINQPDTMYYYHKYTK